MTCSLWRLMWLSHRKELRAKLHQKISSSRGLQWGPVENVALYQVNANLQRPIVCLAVSLGFQANVFTSPATRDTTNYNFRCEETDWDMDTPNKPAPFYSLSVSHSRVGVFKPWSGGQMKPSESLYWAHDKSQITYEPPTLLTLLYSLSCALVVSGGCPESSRGPLSP